MMLSTFVYIKVASSQAFAQPLQTKYLSIGLTRLRTNTPPALHVIRTACCVKQTALTLFPGPPSQ